LIHAGPTRRFVRLGAASGGAPALDADAVTLIAAMTVPPDATRQGFINTLIIDLKAAGVWTKLDILYVMAAHSEQAARLNWKAPGTFTQVNGGTAPTFTTDRGFTGDGISGRLDTTWIPNTHGVNYLQNDASYWVWIVVNAVASTFEIGNVTAPANRMLVRSGANGANGIINDATNTAMVGSGITDCRGLWGMQRPSAAIKKLWQNGVQIGADAAVTSTGRPTQSQWLLGANSANFSGRQEAFGAWGASLAGLEMAFNTPVNAYMTAVGAA
jgi:hypothetical protein